MEVGWIALSLLRKDSIIYSIGVGEDISFDKAIDSITNCNIFGFDPTPRAKIFIENNIEKP